MWQFAVVWSLLPAGVTHWIVNLMLATGVVGLLAGWIGRWIPFFDAYARILKPIGIVLLLSGVYLKGGEANNDMWLARIADLEAKIAVSEAKSKDANAKLSDAVKEKNKAIQESKQAIQNKLKGAAVRIDAECKLDPEAVEILNESAKDIPRAKAKK
ncbi:hypothetical protein UFOVP112_439 [uncultured Caudovirales phage]|uniref:Uncharacterized protein n=1 Tax=uncultured Caudovirales phage TaxID=2100421 RepID=A0A6J5L4U5_9CAUD|nr:hypothetical protein UFOVP112_439 [uncultured Caudovirales phage]